MLAFLHGVVLKYLRMPTVPYPLRKNDSVHLKVFEAKRKPRAKASSALDILNPCFSLHVVTELECGPRHFNDLARSIPASGNTLSSRLRLLEKEGIVRRKVISYMPPSVSYQLTDKGIALAEIVRLLGDWDSEWSNQVKSSQTCQRKLAKDRA